MKYALLLAAGLLAVMPADARQSAAKSTLTLEDCRIRAGRGFPGIKARCGTLKRHENPDDPGSPLLELFFAVVPALTLEPEPDPFVPIAGGPGQASTEFYAAYSGAFELVRRNRDIVLLDQRGTGQSAPLQCKTDDEILIGQYSREEAIAETEECLSQLPYDPRFFTTSVAVRDLEALREALGAPQFNLYGVSYGSRVAQHFLRRYPDSTRTVTLDGVVPPQLALGPAIAIEAQNALDAIFHRCAEDAECALAFPELRAAFEKLRDMLAEGPVTVTLPDPLNGEPRELLFGRVQLAGALRLLSYHPNSVAAVPLLIHEAVLGNFAPLAAQFLMSSEKVADAINIGMHNAVVCTEDAPYFDGEGVARDALDATYIGPLQLDALEAMCSVWPKGVLDAHFKSPVSSNVPVLLLSGEADPITPPRYADLAAVDLGNARLLTGRQQGHGQAPRGCVPNIIAEFVAAADVTVPDVDCLGRLYAMPFFLDFSGPSE
ncbi:MAG TPA: alpha/beta hydrolase [Gammaproteobacteria bacterium]|nr:alpha/beta hydrolase [Gammaproteobacteria bacterium]